MKCNKWTLALAAAGVVSLGSVAQADEAAQHQVLTALSSTTLSGYVDTSAIWKPGTDVGATRLPGHTFDGGDKTDGFNLEAVKLTLEKPLDEGQWSAGYKTDLIFGPNANYYSSLLNGGGGPNTSDFSIKQAYVALRAPIGNGLDFKVGVFDTIIGYEVFETANNPNFSRSYGYALEPTQHTGVLMSYRFNDWLSAAAGVADTSFGAINERGSYNSSVGAPNQVADSVKTYMGSITLTLPESTGPVAGSVIYLGVVNGFAGGTATTPGLPNTEKTTSYYAGATFKTPVENLSAGVAYDYRSDSSAAPIAENNAYAVAGYLTYAITPKMKINNRVDYFNGDQGTFYGNFGTGYAGTTPQGSREHLLSETLTLDYSLWDNVITRAEVRWDHSLTGDRPFGGAGDPLKNALMLAANIIYKF